MGRSMRFRRTFGRRSSRRGAPPSRAPTRRSRSRTPLSERGPMATWWPTLPSSIVAGAREGSDDGSLSARPGPGRLHGRGHNRGSASRTHWPIHQGREKLARRRDDSLDALAGCGMGEGLADLFEGEARRDEPLDAKPRHEGERAPEGGAAAEGAEDPDLTEVGVPEVQGNVASLRAHADELDDARGLDERQALGHQLRGSPGCADYVRPAAAREREHPIAEALLDRIDDGVGPEPPG